MRQKREKRVSELGRGRGGRRGKKRGWEGSERGEMEMRGGREVQKFDKEEKDE